MSQKVSGALIWRFGARGRIRTDDLPIPRRLLGVDLDGSRRIEPAHVEASSIQTDPDRSIQIVRMIKWIIKAHPIERRMLSEVGSR